MDNNTKTNEQGTTTPATLTPVTPAAQDLSISVGTLGNLKKVVLDGSKSWTVGEVLRHQGLDATGYEIRVSSNPANLNTPVTQGNTIVLMTQVRGN
jgi:hypothetical protein